MLIVIIMLISVGVIYPLGAAVFYFVAKHEGQTEIFDKFMDGI